MSIEGVWYNELGSQMTLKAKDNQLIGTYQTAVGKAVFEYELIGGYDSQGNPDKKGQAAGWVVVWSNKSLNSHSSTSWSGQYQVINGVEEITTLWLLTTEKDPENDWAATQINQDIFTREKPAPEQIAKAVKRRMPSHPINKS